MKCALNYNMVGPMMKKCKAWCLVFVYTEIITAAMNAITSSAVNAHNVAIYITVYLWYFGWHVYSFFISSRRHSRSMRSSSPDHHHHHSGSRHRDREPPSHWSHGGWSGSSEHHYPYEHHYDYSSTTSSHHYSRRGRHSGRLGKPEMLMEDARKLKHAGDRTVSLVAYINGNV